MLNITRHRYGVLVDSGNYSIVGLSMADISPAYAWMESPGGSSTVTITNNYPVSVTVKQSSSSNTYTIPSGGTVYLSSIAYSWVSIQAKLDSELPLACQDERTYTDQYLITLNGWDKLGNPVALTKTVTLNGGTDYMPLGFSGQNNPAWLGGIDRATVRALNGSSKNGQLALYARVFKVSVNVFGILTDPVGSLSDNLLIGRFSLSECKAFGSPIAGDGFGLNSPLHYVYDLYLTAQGFTDTGLVCCDDESDETERRLEGEPYAPPLPCDCEAINQYILQLQYRISILEGKYPLKGDKGDKGDTGPQGPQGIAGPQGIQGPKGDKGDKGDTGDTGPKGDKGDKGDTGDTGPKGDKGDKGDTGDTGPQGPQGLQGIQGQQGPQGIQGQAGIDGIDGSDGIDGEDGQNGWITEVEYMAIEDKLQGILDSLTCAERGIACILEKALLKTVDHPEAGEIELGIVDSVIDFEGKAVQQSIEEIEGVTIENEFRVQSRRTEDLPEEV